MKKKKLLITSEITTTFVKKDAALLARHFEVDSLYLKSGNKVLYPFRFLYNFFHICSKLFKAEIILMQGGGYHSFLGVLAAKLIGRPSAIILIGVDAIRMPEISYGHFCNKVLRILLPFAYKHCDLLIPKHSSLIEQKYRFDSIKFCEQGVGAFVRNLKTRWVAVPNGYNLDFWVPKDSERLAHSFITVVGNINTQKRLLVKGVDILLKVSDGLPDYHFTLIGRLPDGVTTPPNLHVKEEVGQEELLELYSSHKYYLQLSRSEGFPNVLCEAMLCGCVPVASDVGGTSDIVGEEGFLLRENKIDRIVGEIMELEDKSCEPRQRIADRYQLGVREQALVQALNELI